MMGRVYTVEFQGVAVTASQDFFEITPADDKPCRVLGIVLSQSTEVGDSAEEMLEVKIIRGHTTSGSGGTSSTPAPMNAIDTAAGFTCEVNNTTIASLGTTVDLWSESFNVRAGWIFNPIPDAMPIVSQAQTTLVVRLLTTPADSITMDGTMIVEEIA